jgi:hypothetical protein
MMESELYIMMQGAVAMASLIASLFFIRFWRVTRDRFFLFFAVSFALLGVNRIMMGFGDFTSEHEPYIYLIRLLAFLIIIAGIADKNRQPNKNKL